MQKKEIEIYAANREGIFNILLIWENVFSIIVTAILCVFLCFTCKYEFVFSVFY